MKVGIHNVAYNMECATCGRQWLAVIEASRIEWTEFHIELHHGDSLECPECGNWTEINRET